MKCGPCAFQPQFLSFASSCWIPFGEHPIKLEWIQRRLAWPLRKDDAHKSRSGPSDDCGVECGCDCDDASGDENSECAQLNLEK